MTCFYIRIGCNLSIFSQRAGHYSPLSISGSLLDSTILRVQMHWYFIVLCWNLFLFSYLHKVHYFLISLQMITLQDQFCIVGLHIPPSFKSTNDWFLLMFQSQWLPNYIPYEFCSFSSSENMLHWFYLWIITTKTSRNNISTKFFYDVVKG